MNHKNWIKTLLAACIFTAASAVAHEYSPGLHQWKIKGGTVFVVSGLLTNNMALYSHNYNFYFLKEGEKSWYQIPLIDKRKAGEYELSITTKAKDDRMVRDARVEIRGNDVFLLLARSTRENDFDSSPVTITKYRLVSPEGDDWPYLFEHVHARTYPAPGESGVDVVLNQEAKKIK